MQSFFGSLVPAARIAALFGTQYQKAALRVVPPRRLAFSSTSTSLPCRRLNNAVARPATPLPMVMISTSASNLPLAAAGAEDLRAIVANPRPPLFVGRRLPLSALADLSNSGFYRILKSAILRSGCQVVPDRITLHYPRSRDDRIRAGLVFASHKFRVCDCELGGSDGTVAPRNA